MVWQKIKKFFKSLWAKVIGFVKEHTFVFAAVATIVIGALYFFLSDRRGLMSFEEVNKMFQDKLQESHKKRVEEIEKRQEVIDKYHEARNQVDEKLAKKRKNVRNEIKKAVKEEAKKYEDDPEGFTKSIAEKYKLELVD